ncbi:MAG: response regulator [Bacteriovoracia bacterium]
MTTNLTLNDVAIPGNLRFFYLEDTVFFQKKMLDHLIELGFTGTVTMSETVAGAIKALATLRPDFILCDWNLPDGKGISLLRHVRLNPAFDGVPFVMVTTIDDVTNILDAVSLGVDGYVVKPFEVEELTEKIAFAYEKRSQGFTSPGA